MVKKEHARETQNLTTIITGGRNAFKKSKQRQSFGRKLLKWWKLIEAIVRDAFCRNVVEKRSELEETYDDMVACSCRVEKVARKRVADSIFNIYTFFDVIYPHQYTCHSSLYIISDNKERNIIIRTHDYHSNNDDGLY